jgi:ABC-type multidrug transport system permease subunit
VSVAPAITPVDGGRFRWLVKDSLTLTGRSFQHWMRDPGPVIFSVVFNLLIVLMFVYLFGGAIQVPGGGRYVEFLMPGIFTMSMLFGIGMTTMAVINDVDRGVTDRFRSMPTSSGSVLIGRAAADMVLSVVTLAIMVGVGLLLGWRAHGSATDALKAFGLILLLRFALIWIGIYLGLALRAAAMTGVQTLEFPIGFLSSVFVSAATMPAWLGVIAEWNPLSSTVTAARIYFQNPGAGGDSWVVDHAVLMAVIWPLVLLAVFFPLSASTYRNLSR